MPPVYVAPPFFFVSPFSLSHHVLLLNHQLESLNALKNARGEVTDMLSAERYDAAMEIAERSKRLEAVQSLAALTSCRPILRQNADLVAEVQDAMCEALIRTLVSWVNTSNSNMAAAATTAAPAATTTTSNSQQETTLQRNLFSPHLRVIHSLILRGLIVRAVEGSMPWIAARAKVVVKDVESASIKPCVISLCCKFS